MSTNNPKERITLAKKLPRVNFGPFAKKQKLNNGKILSNSLSKGEK